MGCLVMVQSHAGLFLLAAKAKGLLAQLVEHYAHKDPGSKDCHLIAKHMSADGIKCSVASVQARLDMLCKIQVNI